MRQSVSSLVLKTGDDAKERKMRGDEGMDTVKARTTVSGHSPVHTSVWFPLGLTSV